MSAARISPRSEQRGRPKGRPKGRAAVLVAIAAALAALLSASSKGGPATDGVVPQPVLGAADLEMVLMGAAPGGEPGETWGYRRMPPEAGLPQHAGRRLDFAPVPGSREPQLAFLRYTHAGGWRFVETPLDEHGRPYRGFSPSDLSARITEHGGGILIGRDLARTCGVEPPAGEQCPADQRLAPEAQVTVLSRDPGGRFAVLPSPPPEVLRPAGDGQPAEALAEEFGAGAAAAAAYERDGRTAALFAVEGPAAETAVVHWDGSDWTREPVEPPPGSEQELELIALAASGPDNAWLLARADDRLGRGIVLLERRERQGEARWVERTLGAPLFEHRATPERAVSDVRALDGRAAPLTVTADGVWIDGSLRTGTSTRNFSLFFDSGEGGVTGSWCDARDDGGTPLCTEPLGASLSEQIGYRSFAWSGDRFGSRVITNPLEVGAGNATNRGTYLSLQGSQFVRMPGAGGNFRPGGAFSSPEEGWLDGPVHVTRSPEPVRMTTRWPLSLRSPLTAVASAPGGRPGSVGEQALAVGLDGAVARHVPGQGWVREFLLSSSGSVSRPALRGVAWPTTSRAHAVGDTGALWLWRRETALWEKDPGAPIGFEAHLTDVAFDPTDPDRGYAVGRTGALLAYGKSWTQEPLPAGFEQADFTQIAFAGRQAIVVARRDLVGSDLLVNDGSGWRVDEDAHRLLRSLGGEPQLFALGALGDGGAVAAGEHVVIERDGAGSGWRFSDQPLPGSSVAAAAAFREGGRVRAIVSVVPRLRYPADDRPPVVDPNEPPPIQPPFPPSPDGYVLRETAEGWRDEQHAAFRGSGLDRPLKADPVLDFALDADGSGWAVGGWGGEVDSAERGSGGRNPTGRGDRQRAQTAAVFRYGDDAPPPGASAAGVPMPAGPVRIAVAGHAQCELPCADLSAQGIGPDMSLTAALAKVQALSGRPWGPRLFVYTGGRQRPGSGANGSAREASRYAELLGSAPGLPVYAAASRGDLGAGGDLGAFTSAFAPFPAPFGDGPPPPGVSPVPTAGAAARSHYALDTSGAGGTARMVVIDNSTGAIGAEQASWLRSVLADARARGLPSIVVGSRDLNTRFTPKINTASDGAEIARILVEEGASAYFFERPEENRSYRIPSGATDTIPSFGTGTLGYRSALSNALGFRLPVDDPNSADDPPDALFGDSGFLLAEIDVAHRDPATNRAPVSARLVPLIDDLSLQALDGVLLRRSRPALFQGIGRRPLAGDRWGRISSADGNANPPGSDPHVSFPPAQCLIAGCSTRVEPEYDFSSSDPDIADFVKQDPQSANLRKPFIGPGDKVVSDSRSGLLCPFNAGTTTVTVRAGGLAYSQRVTVQAGSVQRPCGTRPLRPDRFKRASAGASAPPPPAPAPGGDPPLSFAPPPPPAALPQPDVSEPSTRPPPRGDFLPALENAGYLPPVPLPTPPPAVRPSPPSGGLGRAYQVEEKREEEAAPEESQAFAAYNPDEGGLPPAFVLAAIVLAAFAGAAILAGPRTRDRRYQAAVAAARPASEPRAQSRRRL